MRTLLHAARMFVLRPRAVLLPLFLLLCASCDGARFEPSRPPAAAPDRTRDDSPERSQFRLRVGETLRVRLDASPATGYAWTLQGSLSPTLRMESDPGALPRRGRPGVARTQAWTFRAQRRGRARLRFLYGREWELLSAATDRREIDVEVE